MVTWPGLLQPVWTSAGWYRHQTCGTPFCRVHTQVPPKKHPANSGMHDKYRKYDVLSIKQIALKKKKGPSWIRRCSESQRRWLRCQERKSANLLPERSQGLKRGDLIFQLTAWVLGNQSFCVVDCCALLNPSRRYLLKQVVSWFCIPWQKEISTRASLLIHDRVTLAFLSRFK